MMGPERYKHWKRAPGLLHWYRDDLPGWCVTSTFEADRKGVYRRVFVAQYGGVRVGEVYPGTSPEPVLDDLTDLLGLEPHSQQSSGYSGVRL